MKRVGAFALALPDLRIFAARPTVEERYESTLGGTLPLVYTRGSEGRFVGQGFRPAAELPLGVPRYGIFAYFEPFPGFGDAERKLDGRAEALPHMALGVCLAAVLLCASCAARHPVAISQPSAEQYAQQRQAINAVDAGDGDYEVKLLRVKLDANPRDLNTRLELARRYQKLGFPEVAIEHCRLACERAPDSDDAHIALAKMLRDTGRAPEGAKVLADYSAKREAGVSVLAWLGLISDEAGDWKAGEAAHRKALALAPGREDLHNNLGYCLLLQNKKKEAAEEFRAALRINSTSVMATNNLATAIGEGSRKEAVERLQAVTDPASAHNNMAAVLIDAGRYAEARQEIDVALSYNRQHSAALSNLALVSRMDGQPATVKAPVSAALVNEGRWARAVHAWRHLWGSGVPSDRKTKDSGTTTASQ